MTFGAARAYLEEYYNNKPDLETADPINVPAATLISGIDAILDRGGVIMGMVTAADTGLPLDDVDIDILDDEGNTVASNATDATDMYTVSGVPTGNYRVLFEPFTFGGAADYALEYYNDKINFNTADIVAVTAPNSVNNVNAVLLRGGRIYSADPITIVAPNKVTNINAALPIPGQPTDFIYLPLITNN